MTFLNISYKLNSRTKSEITKMTYENMRAALFLESKREPIEDMTDLDLIKLFHQCK